MPVHCRRMPQVGWGLCLCFVGNEESSLPFAAVITGISLATLPSTCEAYYPEGAHMLAVTHGLQNLLRVSVLGTQHVAKTLIHPEGWMPALPYVKLLGDVAERSKFSNATVAPRVGDEEVDGLTPPHGPGKPWSSLNCFSLSTLNWVEFCLKSSAFARKLEAGGPSVLGPELAILLLPVYAAQVLPAHLQDEHAANAARQAETTRTHFLGKWKRHLEQLRPRDHLVLVFQEQRNVNGPTPKPEAV